MIACIFGRTGSGKSILLKRMTRSSRRAIVVDPLSEHDELGVIPADMDAFRDFWIRMHTRERWKVVLQPRVLGTKGEDPSEVLEPYLRVAGRSVMHGGPDFILAVDEVDRFVDTHRKHRDISIVINYGRHRGVHLIAVARRTQAVPSEMIAQCSDLYVFHMHRPGDIDYLRPHLSPDAADRITSLEVHQCVHWHVSGRWEVLHVPPPVDPAES
jgi:DNA helicase HerA-like ATPase